MRKCFTAVPLLCMLVFFTSAGTTASAQSIAKTCEYEQTQGENPDQRTMNCLLTEAALMYDVPPEIVKAIAETESGDWRHFDDNGEAIITDDGGIGIMQITNQANYDEERLKKDVVYNIQAGVEILDGMFKRSDLPTINGNERDVLEHWYFSIMAYNGTKPINSPVVQASGERNSEAYQEKVFDMIKRYGLIDVQRLPFKPEDFRYDNNSDANIEFVTMDYHFELPFTNTKHHFKKGQKAAATTNARVRARPTTSSSSKGQLNKGEIVSIEGTFQYEEDRNKKNHFVWYPIKRSDGTTGYVASSYLDYRYSDVPAGRYSEDAIYYLTKRGILQGVGNDQFAPEQRLTRWQAALMLVRAHNVSLENRPDPGFTDVPYDYEYYDVIAAAVDEGLFEGKDDNKFDPGAALERREMAVLLQRIYDFPAANESPPFTDINDDDWYADAVNRLYKAGITDGMTETTFAPRHPVTREQFAVFMTRSIDENLRLK